MQVLYTVRLACRTEPDRLYRKLGNRASADPYAYTKHSRSRFVLGHQNRINPSGLLFLPPTKYSSKLHYNVPFSACRAHERTKRIIHDKVAQAAVHINKSKTIISQTYHRASFSTAAQRTLPKSRCCLPLPWIATREESKTHRYFFSQDVIATHLGLVQQCNTCEQTSLRC